MAFSVDFIELFIRTASSAKRFNKLRSGVSVCSATQYTRKRLASRWKRFVESGHHSRHSSIFITGNLILTDLSLSSRIPSGVHRIWHAIERLRGKAWVQPPDDDDEQELLEVDRVNGNTDTNDNADFR